MQQSGNCKGSWAARGSAEQLEKGWWHGAVQVSGQCGGLGGCTEQLKGWWPGVVQLTG